MEGRKKGDEAKGGGVPQWVDVKLRNGLWQPARVLRATERDGDGATGLRLLVRYEPFRGQDEEIWFPSEEVAPFRTHTQGFPEGPARAEDRRDLCADVSFPPHTKREGGGAAGEGAQPAPPTSAERDPEEGGTERKSEPEKGPEEKEEEEEMGPVAEEKGKGDGERGTAEAAFQTGYEDLDPGDLCEAYEEALLFLETHQAEDWDPVWVRDFLRGDLLRFLEVICFFDRTLDENGEQRPETEENEGQFLDQELKCSRLLLVVWHFFSFWLEKTTALRQKSRDLSEAETHFVDSFPEMVSIIQILFASDARVQSFYERQSSLLIRLEKAGREFSEALPLSFTEKTRDILPAPTLSDLPAVALMKREAVAIAEDPDKGVKGEAAWQERANRPSFCQNSNVSVACLYSFRHLLVFNFVVWNTHYRGLPRLVACLQSRIESMDKSQPRGGGEGGQVCKFALGLFELLDLLRPFGFLVGRISSVSSWTIRVGRMSEIVLSLQDAIFDRIPLLSDSEVREVGAGGSRRQELLEIFTQILTPVHDKLAKSDLESVLIVHLAVRTLRSGGLPNRLSALGDLRTESNRAHRYEKQRKQEKVEREQKRRRQIENVKAKDVSVSPDGTIEEGEDSDSESSPIASAVLPILLFSAEDADTLVEFDRRFVKDIHILSPEGFAEWIASSDLLKDIFGESAHPEVVKRSLFLFTFLIDQQRLQPSHLEIVWACGNAAVTHGALTRAVFDLLIEMGSTLPPSLVRVIVQKANDLSPVAGANEREGGVEGEKAGGTQGEEGGVEITSSFSLPVDAQLLFFFRDFSIACASAATPPPPPSSSEPPQAADSGSFALPFFWRLSCGGQGGLTDNKTAVERLMAEEQGESPILPLPVGAQGRENALAVSAMSASSSASARPPPLSPSGNAPPTPTLLTAQRCFVDILASPPFARYRSEFLHRCVMDLAGQPDSATSIGLIRKIVEAFPSQEREDSTPLDPSLFKEHAISRLQLVEGILQMVLDRSLPAFARTASEARAKLLSSESTVSERLRDRVESLLLSHLWSLLDFLVFLTTNSTLRLSLLQLRQVWDLVVPVENRPWGDKGREVVFLWLSKICAFTFTSKVFSRQMLEPLESEALTRFFAEIICHHAKVGGYAKLSEIGLLAFVNMMKLANRRDCNDGLSGDSLASAPTPDFGNGRAFHHSQVVDADTLAFDDVTPLGWACGKRFSVHRWALEGYETLWEIVLQVEDPWVFELSADFLTDLHVFLHPHKETARLQDGLQGAFIDRCKSWLQRASGGEREAEGEEETENLSGPESTQTEARVHKALSLLTKIFRKSATSTLTQTHAVWPDPRVSGVLCSSSLSLEDGLFGEFSPSHEVEAFDSVGTRRQFRSGTGASASGSGVGAPVRHHPSHQHHHHNVTLYVSRKNATADGGGDPKAITLSTGSTIGELRDRVASAYESRSLMTSLYTSRGNHFIDTDNDSMTIAECRIPTALHASVGFASKLKESAITAHNKMRLQAHKLRMRQTQEEGAGLGGLLSLTGLASGVTGAGDRGGPGGLGLYLPGAATEEDTNPHLARQTIAKDPDFVDALLDLLGIGELHCEQAAWGVIASLPTHARQYEILGRLCYRHPPPSAGDARGRRAHTPLFNELYCEIADREIALKVESRQQKHRGRRGRIRRGSGEREREREKRAGESPGSDELDDVEGGRDGSVSTRQAGNVRLRDVEDDPDDRELLRFWQLHSRPSNPSRLLFFLRLVYAVLSSSELQPPPLSVVVPPRLTGGNGARSGQQRGGGTGGGERQQKGSRGVPPGEVFGGETSGEAVVGHSGSGGGGSVSRTAVKAAGAFFSGVAALMGNKQQQQQQQANDSSSLGTGAGGVPVVAGRGGGQGMARGGSGSGFFSLSLPGNAQPADGRSEVASTTVGSTSGGDSRIGIGEMRGGDGGGFGSSYSDWGPLPPAPLWACAVVESGGLEQLLSVFLTFPFSCPLDGFLEASEADAFGIRLMAFSMMAEVLCRLLSPTTYDAPSLGLTPPDVYSRLRKLSPASVGALQGQRRTREGDANEKPGLDERPLLGQVVAKCLEGLRVILRFRDSSAEQSVAKTAYIVEQKKEGEMSAVGNALPPPSTYSRSAVRGRQGEELGGLKEGSSCDSGSGSALSLHLTFVQDWEALSGWGGREGMGMRGGKLMSGSSSVGVGVGRVSQLVRSGGDGRSEKSSCEGREEGGSGRLSETAGAVHRLFALVGCCVSLDRSSVSELSEFEGWTNLLVEGLLRSEDAGVRSAFCDGVFGLCGAVDGSGEGPARGGWGSLNVRGRGAAGGQRGGGVEEETPVLSNQILPKLLFEVLPLCGSLSLPSSEETKTGKGQKRRGERRTGRGGKDGTHGPSHAHSEGCFRLAAALLEDSLTESAQSRRDPLLNYLQSLSAKRRAAKRHHADLADPFSLGLTATFAVAFNAVKSEGESVQDATASSAEIGKLISTVFRRLKRRRIVEMSTDDEDRTLRGMLRLLSSLLLCFPTQKCSTKLADEAVWEVLHACLLAVPSFPLSLTRSMLGTGSRGQGAQPAGAVAVPHSAASVSSAQNQAARLLPENENILAGGPVVESLLCRLEGADGRQQKRGVASQTMQRLPRCKSAASRKAAWDLLLYVTAHGPLATERVCRYISLCLSLQLTAPRPRRSADWLLHAAGQERTEAAFVGLKNLGCTCYMNSLLQHMFAHPGFRQSIMRADAKRAAVARVREKNEAVTQASVQAALERSVLFQTQAVFAALRASERHFFSPKGLVAALRDFDGRPIDPVSQMDADEFFNLWTNQLEEDLKRGGAPHAGAIARLFFGGTLVNELICRDCPHSSSREDDSMVAQLVVAGKTTLVDSLEASVEGELLQGDNAFHCLECDARVTTLKRQCFGRLPDTLLLQLKRFEFDYDAMTKFKVNDYLQFPTELDMKPYTRQGLHEAEAEQGRARPSGDSQSFETFPDEYFQYTLRGVVIHVGTAESGHYYSLLRLPADNCHLEDIDEDSALLDQARRNQSSSHKRTAGPSEPRPPPLHLKLSSPLSGEEANSKLEQNGGDPLPLSIRLPPSPGGVAEEEESEDSASDLEGPAGSTNKRIPPLHSSSSSSFVVPPTGSSATPIEYKWYQFNDTLVTPFRPEDIPAEAFGFVDPGQGPGMRAGGPQKSKSRGAAASSTLPGPAKPNASGGLSNSGWDCRNRNAYILLYERKVKFGPQDLSSVKRPEEAEGKEEEKAKPAEEAHPQGSPRHVAEQRDGGSAPSLEETEKGAVEPSALTGALPLSPLDASASSSSKRPHAAALADREASARAEGKAAAALPPRSSDDLVDSATKEEKEKGTEPEGEQRRRASSLDVIAGEAGALGVHGGAALGGSAARQESLVAAANERLWATRSLFASDFADFVWLLAVNHLCSPLTTQFPPMPPVATASGFLSSATASGLPRRDYEAPQLKGGQLKRTLRGFLPVPAGSDEESKQQHDRASPALLGALCEVVFRLVASVVLRSRGKQRLPDWLSLLGCLAERSDLAGIAVWEREESKRAKLALSSGGDPSAGSLSLPLGQASPPFPCGFSFWFLRRFIEEPEAVFSVLAEAPAKDEGARGVFLRLLSSSLQWVHPFLLGSLGGEVKEGERESPGRTFLSVCWRSILMMLKKSRERLFAAGGNVGGVRDDEEDVDMDVGGETVRGASGDKMNHVETGLAAVAEAAFEFVALGYEAASIAAREGGLMVALELIFGQQHLLSIVADDSPRPKKKKTKGKGKKSGAGKAPPSPVPQALQERDISPTARSHRSMSPLTNPARSVSTHLNVSCTQFLEVARARQSLEERQGWTRTRPWLSLLEAGVPFDPLTAEGSAEGPASSCEETPATSGRGGICRGPVPQAPLFNLPRSHPCYSSLSALALELSLPAPRAVAEKEKEAHEEVEGQAKGSGPAHKPEEPDAKAIQEIPAQPEGSTVQNGQKETLPLKEEEEGAQPEGRGRLPSSPPAPPQSPPDSQRVAQRLAVLPSVQPAALLFDGGGEGGTSGWSDSQGEEPDRSRDLSFVFGMVALMLKAMMWGPQSRDCKTVTEVIQEIRKEDATLREENGQRGRGEETCGESEGKIPSQGVGENAEKEKAGGPNSSAATAAAPPSPPTSVTSSPALLPLSASSLLQALQPLGTSAFVHSLIRAVAFGRPGTRPESALGLTMCGALGPSGLSLSLSLQGGGDFREGEGELRSLTEGGRLARAAGSVLQCLCWQDNDMSEMVLSLLVQYVSQLDAVPLRNVIGLFPPLIELDAGGGGGAGVHGGPEPHPRLFHLIALLAAALRDSSQCIRPTLIGLRALLLEWAKKYPDIARCLRLSSSGSASRAAGGGNSPPAPLRWVEAWLKELQSLTSQVQAVVASQAPSAIAQAHAASLQKGFGGGGFAFGGGMGMTSSPAQRTDKAWQRPLAMPRGGKGQTPAAPDNVVSLHRNLNESLLSLVTDLLNAFRRHCTESGTARAAAGGGQGNAASGTGTSQTGGERQAYPFIAPTMTGPPLQPLYAPPPASSSREGSSGSAVPLATTFAAAVGGAQTGAASAFVDAPPLKDFSADRAVAVRPVRAGDRVWIRTPFPVCAPPSDSSSGDSSGVIVPGPAAAAVAAGGGPAGDHSEAAAAAVGLSGSSVAGAASLTLSSVMQMVAGASGGGAGGGVPAGAPGSGGGGRGPGGGPGGGGGGSQGVAAGRGQGGAYLGSATHAGVYLRWTSGMITARVARFGTWWERLWGGGEDGGGGRAREREGSFTSGQQLSPSGSAGSGSAFVGVAADGRGKGTGGRKPTQRQKRSGSASGERGGGSAVCSSSFGFSEGPSSCLGGPFELNEQQSLWTHQSSQVEDWGTTSGSQRALPREVTVRPDGFPSRFDLTVAADLHTIGTSTLSGCLIQDL
uniref:USP domain-containing protein n=1 Tax=Chromera velia CCMP2878 TaxID=1169474 RepID=A0A0G4F3Y3_9ALVE|eukprot:Cvel_15033.t1-p1 / transcript=Cvel_15033.t1 / gene=Cvel_15033 / organism=Chromera_velia_CCMP2878 / gene_product=Probable ubiquitin carboxyl-terminal hydrolase FAF, putative / transcript_product=Probable ubiquitin carboxyl-terminal hydrolase FAF, putative / location=Cvel_scaffold1094:8869-32155(+) / protein_length=4881 / sequence_SO=supercontig / SO=protein_coding / is_pseudo=false